MILQRLKLAISASHTALENQLPLMNADLAAASPFRQFTRHDHRQPLRRPSARFPFARK